MPKHGEVQKSRGRSRLCELRTSVPIPVQWQNRRPGTLRSASTGLLQLGGPRVRQSLSQSLPQLEVHERLQFRTQNAHQNAEDNES